MHRFRILTSAGLCLCLAAPVTAEWSDAFHLGADLNGAVVDAVEYDGGLVVCGPFTADEQGVRLNHVARWDAGWHPLGDGLTEAPACLSVHDGVLRAGGWRWDGSAWVRELPDGVEPVAMTFLDGDAIVALPGPLGTRLDRWVDPLLLTLGEADGEVRDLIVHDGELVVAGAFPTIDDVASPNVARWSETAGWRALGAGLEGERVGCCTPDGASWPVEDSVAALLSYDGDLYATGSFTISGGDSLACVARYRNGVWQALGTGLDRPVTTTQVNGSLLVMPPQGFDLAVYDGRVHVGGLFAGAGDVISSGLAAWDGSGWSGAASGVGTTALPSVPSIHVLCPYGEGLTAFGSFDRADDAPAVDSASWNGATWSPSPGSSGLGLDGDVWVLGEWNGLLIAGGEFRTYGDTLNDNLAAFDGGNWRLLGATGPDAVVRSIGEWEGDLIVGGAFNSIDGITARRCARWDGASWLPMDAGLEQVIYDFAIYEGDLYAGTGPSDLLPDKDYPPLLCRWDGDHWIPVVTTISNWWGTWALEAHDDALFIATIDECLRFDGQSAVVDLDILALDLGLHDGLLYAGLDAYPYQDAYFRCLARREPEGWHAVGVFPNHVDQVRCLASLDGALYGGGRITEVDGVITHNVFRLDGETFSALGDGLSMENGLGRAFCAAAYDGSVWFGGEFTTAGGVPSHGVARWTPTVVAIEPSEPPEDPLPLPARTGLESVRPNPFNPGTRITWTQERPGPVELAVYDLAGRRVAVLAAEPFGTGEHFVEWHGRDASGRAVASGAYLLRLTVNGETSSRKLVLAR